MRSITVRGSFLRYLKYRLSSRKVDQHLEQVILHQCVGHINFSNQSTVDLDEHVFVEGKVKGRKPADLKLIEPSFYECDNLSITVKVESSIDFYSLEVGRVADRVPHLAPSEHVYVLAFVRAVPVGHV